MAFSCFTAILVSVVIIYSVLTQSSTIGVDYIARLLEIQDRERAPPSVQLSAARGVLRRLLPSHSSSFEFQIISKEHCGGQSCFKISSHPSLNTRGTPEILIRGVTGVEILAGLHWYLKYWCGAHISWDKTGGAQLSSVPKSGSLPHIQDTGVLIQRPIPWNYYQNAVTSSYSFAWWNWERWEKEIDWMALQGVNLPLAFTGQEAIWQKVFQNFNISSSDLNGFFGGPAFLAWSRMGNLHGWGGPLPQSWFDAQLKLQKKILARMYELGMTPVLPAFSGNVPKALKRIFPSAKITRLGNCDTFDENTPPTDDPEYISSLGAAIFKGMESGDEDAVWLMQGWLFSYDPFWKPRQMKALLHSVPTGRMVVLDLFAEVKPIWSTSEQFYGVPYIWCMLHNFAGNIEMYGILDAIGSGPVDACISENSTMVGVGMSMEGIEQNPVVYDLMSEMAFQHHKIDVKSWIDNYSGRRYGKFVPSMQEAWNILYHSVYNCTDGSPDKNRDVILMFPDVDPSFITIPQISGHLKYPNYHRPASRRAFLKEQTDTFDQPHLWYSTSEVIHALELFIVSGNELSGSNTYRYDLIDLTRQALAKYANELFFEVIEAYRSYDVREVAHLSQEFLDLVEDMDTLLGSHDGFLLGPWLESAKQLATDKEQEKQFEWNARTQITMWFDNTEEEASLLRDYGNKYWSGLLRDYYGPRAAMYFKFLMESLLKGVSFPLKDWRREWIKLTNDWQNGRDVFPVESSGDALNISQWLYNKYLRDAYAYKSVNKAVINNRSANL